MMLRSRFRKKLHKKFLARAERVAIAGTIAGDGQNDGGNDSAGDEADVDTATGETGVKAARRSVGGMTVKKPASAGKKGRAVAAAKKGVTRKRKATSPASVPDEEESAGAGDAYYEADVEVLKAKRATRGDRAAARAAPPAAADPDETEPEDGTVAGTIEVAGDTDADLDDDFFPRSASL